VRVALSCVPPRGRSERVVGVTLPDALEVEYNDGRGERIEFSERPDGRVDVVEKALTKSGDYRTVGHEVADSVSVE
jgi:hypothetical protein